jgi:exopolysaccharide biosynthesis polyprenyl glycosylphosphotransferase
MPPLGNISERLVRAEVEHTLQQEHGAGAAHPSNGPTGVVNLRPNYERPRVKAVQPNRWRILTLVTAVVDLTAIALGLLAASALRFGGAAWGGPSAYGRWIAVWVPLWWLVLLAVGLYDRLRMQNPAEELKQLVRGVTLAAGIAALASFAVGFPLSRLWALIAWATTLTTLALGRRAVRKTVHSLRRRGRLRRRALIVGTDGSARALAADVARAPWEGLDVVGFVSNDNATTHREAMGIGTVHDLRELSILHGISEVLVAPSVAGNGHLGEVVGALDGVPVDLRIAPGLDGFLPSRLAVQPVGDRAVLGVERIELQPAARLLKRTLDLVLGSVLMLLSFPVMAAAAVAIRLDSPGPVIFRQKRIGVGGRAFTLWKFRTMVVDAEERKASLREHNEAGGPLFKLRHDPRVTRIGRLLRRWSLDELPQLFNVLAGDMSLVGPRPPLPEEVATYDSRLGRRLLVRPGITGLWQVSGRGDLRFEDYVRHDLMYVQNWSTALDFYILVKTIPAVLSKRGAY